MRHTRQIFASVLWALSALFPAITLGEDHGAEEPMAVQENADRDELIKQATSALAKAQQSARNGDNAGLMLHARAAVSLCERADPVEAYPNGDDHFVMALQLLGAGLFRQGDLEGSLECNERALRMCRGLYPP